jgi:hypothetical protein
MNRESVIPAQAGIQYEKDTPRSGQDGVVVPLARGILDPLDSGLRRNDRLMDYLE